MPKSDIQQAAKEHEYDKLPFTEIQVDKCNKITTEEANLLEVKTKEQSDCKLWHLERRDIITASRFGDICTATAASNYLSQWSSIFIPPKLLTGALKYGN